jgi:hypothetical protein
VISLDAILVLASISSVSLDACIQKTLSRGASLDAIIGIISNIIMPTGRVVLMTPSERLIAIPPSERLITVLPADRFIA